MKKYLRHILAVMSVGVILNAFISCEKSNDEPVKNFTVKGVSFEMIYVKAGKFVMGCTPDQEPGWKEEKPAHPVTLTADYYIGKYEVTQQLWQTVTGKNIKDQRDLVDPRYALKGEGDNLPMYYVSYGDCITFCTLLNELLTDKLPAGYKFDFPTEAQWEYAARGGKKSAGTKYSGSNDINTVAWYADNSGKGTHEVGTLAANELGIYDMSGNVHEWCKDWYSATYYTDISSGATNPTGPATGSYRVVRGGGFEDEYISRCCRVSIRGLASPTHRYDDIGFRLALVPK